MSTTRVTERVSQFTGKRYFVVEEEEESPDVIREFQMPDSEDKIPVNPRPCELSREKLLNEF